MRNFRIAGLLVVAFLLVLSAPASAARLPRFDTADVTLTSEKAEYAEGEIALVTVQVLRAFTQEPISSGELQLTATFPDGFMPIGVTKVDAANFNSITAALKSSDPNIYSVQVFQTDTDLQKELEQERDGILAELDSLRKERAEATNLFTRVWLDARISLRDRDLSKVLANLGNVTQLIGTKAMGLFVRSSTPVASKDPCDSLSGAQVVFGPEKYWQRFLFPNNRRFFTTPAAGQVCISVKNGSTWVWQRATKGEIKLDGKVVIDSSRFGSGV
ncbi:MAG: hypothetical protein HY897_07905, partial [Deltaproteobacteria bacterium]|nr:hypothetical protein [Deltaproteobacteria bacterium]